MLLLKNTNYSYKYKEKLFLFIVVAIALILIGCSPSTVEVGKKNFEVQVIKVLGESVRRYRCSETTEILEGNELLKCQLLFQGSNPNWYDYQCETTDMGKCSEIK